MNSILVTGAAGFLGRSLCQQLLDRGHEVVGIDDGSRSANSTLLFKCHKFDVRDSGSVRSVLRYHNVDTVFHLAAINGTRNFYERPREVLDVGISGVQSVVKACEQEGVKNFCFYSSSEVYQTAKVIPTPEGVELKVPDVQNPRYTYGLGKIVGEMLALHSGVFENVLIVRPHNVYGPAMGFDHVIPELVIKTVRAEPNGVLQVELPSKGKSSTRAFCYVDDFTRAVVSLWCGKCTGIFHVGTEHEVSISWLARMVTKICTRPDLTIEPVSTKRGGTDRRCPDTQKLRTVLSIRTEWLKDGAAKFEGVEAWEPKVSIGEGLVKTVRWYLDHQDVWPV